MASAKHQLAVAGLDQHSIDSQIRKLESFEFQQLHQRERAVLNYAGRVVAQPSCLDIDDLSDLVAQVGEQRAIDVIWWASRCHFMVRISTLFLFDPAGDFSDHAGNSRSVTTAYPFEVGTHHAD